MDRAHSLVRKTDPAAEAESDAEADLAEARARLRASFAALQTRWGEMRDWRGWVRRHPFPFLVGAFALGALVGSRRRP